MKKVLLSLVAAVFVLTSCGGPNAMEFNEAIVKANTEIAEVFNGYSQEITKAAASQDFSQMAAVMDSAVAKIDSKLDVIKALEAPKGGDDFKAAAIELYEYSKSLIETGKKFTTLTKDSSVDDFNKIQEEYNKKMEGYNDLLKKTQAAQQEFAKANNMELRY